MLLVENCPDFIVLQARLYVKMSEKWPRLSTQSVLESPLLIHIILSKFRKIRQEANMFTVICDLVYWYKIYFCQSLNYFNLREITLIVWPQYSLITLLIYLVVKFVSCLLDLDNLWPFRNPSNSLVIKSRAKREMCQYNLALR